MKRMNSYINLIFKYKFTYIYMNKGYGSILFIEWIKIISIINMVYYKIK